MHGLDNSIGRFNYINDFHTSSLLDNIIYIYGVFKMNSLKEIFITVIACMAVGVLIGFLIGERSMCNQLGGMYSNDYGRCFPVKEEVRVK